MGRGESRLFAANDRSFRIAAGLPMRGEDQDLGSLRHLWRWVGLFREIEITIDAYARPDVGADLRITVDAHDDALTRLQIQLLQLLDAEGTVVAEGAIRWGGNSGTAGRAQAILELGNDADVLVKAVRRGGVSARLELVPGT